MRRLETVWILVGVLALAAATVRASGVSGTPVRESGTPAWPECTGDGEAIALWPTTNVVPHYVFRAPEMAWFDDGLTRVRDVSFPALKFYPAPPCGIPHVPGDSHPHPAFIVCPDGGDAGLGVYRRGGDVVDYLNVRGIHAFVLKHRTPGQREAARCDVQRAVSFVRANAARFNVDPARIGIVGFSGGGHLAAVSAVSWTARGYAAADAVDKASCRPDFVALVSPAGAKATTAALVMPGLDVPPCFLFQTEDDRCGAAALAFYMALRQARVPAELHVMPPRANAPGRPACPCVDSGWAPLLEAWLGHVVFGDHC